MALSLMATKSVLIKWGSVDGINRGVPIGATYPMVKDKMSMMSPPATVEIPMARTMAQGTAVEALEACREGEMDA